MAERVKPTATEPSAAEQAAEDLTVMFPDSTVSIAGESITVSEYPFMQWLQLKPAHLPFLEQLAELVGHAAEGVVMDDLMEFFENQFQHVQALLAASTNKPEEFFNGLLAHDIELLMMTWWSVNKHFFLRSVHRTLRKQSKAQSDGQTSSNP